MAAVRVHVGVPAPSRLEKGETSLAGFAEDIKPLFREYDQVEMEWAFDLWNYEDVRDNADAIAERLEAGSMPCDGAWPEEQVEKFRRWIRDGMQP
jgi:hypothetical protein